MLASVAIDHFPFSIGRDRNRIWKGPSFKARTMTSDPKAATGDRAFETVQSTPVTLPTSSPDPASRKRSSESSSSDSSTTTAPPAPYTGPPQHPAQKLPSISALLNSVSPPGRPVQSTEPSTYRTEAIPRTISPTSYAPSELERKRRRPSEEAEFDHSPRDHPSRRSPSRSHFQLDHYAHQSYGYGRRGSAASAPENWNSPARAQHYYTSSNRTSPRAPRPMLPATPYGDAPYFPQRSNYEVRPHYPGPPPPAMQHIPAMAPDHRSPNYNHYPPGPPPHPMHAMEPAYRSPHYSDYPPLPPPRSHSFSGPVPAMQDRIPFSNTQYNGWQHPAPYSNDPRAQYVTEGPIPYRMAPAPVQYGEDGGEDGSDNKTRKRRGNLPKETTDKLKVWFHGHLHHPYPTEEEKQELMRQTGLQLNQVSNWFINARRRQLPQLANDARLQATAVLRAEAVSRNPDMNSFTGSSITGTIEKDENSRNENRV